MTNFFILFFCFISGVKLSDGKENNCVQIIWKSLVDDVKSVLLHSQPSTLAIDKNLLSLCSPIEKNIILEILGEKKSFVETVVKAQKYHSRRLFLQSEKDVTLIDCGSLVHSFDTEITLRIRQYFKVEKGAAIYNDSLMKLDPLLYLESIHIGSLDNDVSKATLLLKRIAMQVMKSKTDLKLFSVDFDAAVRVVGARAASLCKKIQMNAEIELAFDDLFNSSADQFKIAKAISGLNLLRNCPARNEIAGEIVILESLIKLKTFCAMIFKENSGIASDSITKLIDFDEKKAMKSLELIPWYNSEYMDDSILSFEFTPTKPFTPSDEDLSNLKMSRKKLLFVAFARSVQFAKIIVNEDNFIWLSSNALFAMKMMIKAIYAHDSSAFISWKILLDLMRELPQIKFSFNGNLFVLRDSSFVIEQISDMDDCVPSHVIEVCCNLFNIEWAIELYSENDLKYSFESNESLILADLMMSSSERLLQIYSFFSSAFLSARTALLKLYERNDLIQLKLSILDVGKFYELFSLHRLWNTRDMKIVKLLFFACRMLHHMRSFIPVDLQAAAKLSVADTFDPDHVKTLILNFERLNFANIPFVKSSDMSTLRLLDSFLSVCLDILSEEMKFQFQKYLSILYPILLHMEDLSGAYFEMLDVAYRLKDLLWSFKHAKYRNLLYSLGDFFTSSLLPNNIFLIVGQLRLLAQHVQLDDDGVYFQHLTRLLAESLNCIGRMRVALFSLNPPVLKFYSFFPRSFTLSAAAYDQVLKYEPLYMEPHFPILPLSGAIVNAAAALLHQGRQSEFPIVSFHFFMADFTRFINAILKSGNFSITALLMELKSGLSHCYQLAFSMIPLDNLTRIWKAASVEELDKVHVKTQDPHLRAVVDLFVMLKHLKFSMMSFYTVVDLEDAHMIKSLVSDRILEAALKFEPISPSLSDDWFGRKENTIFENCKTEFQSSKEKQIDLSKLSSRKEEFISFMLNPSKSVVAVKMSINDGFVVLDASDFSIFSKIIASEYSNVLLTWTQVMKVIEIFPGISFLQDKNLFMAHMNGENMFACFVDEESVSSYYLYQIRTLLNIKDPFITLEVFEDASVVNPIEKAIDPLRDYMIHLDAIDYDRVLVLYRYFYYLFHNFMRNRGLVSVKKEDFKSKFIEYSPTIYKKSLIESKLFKVAFDILYWFREISMVSVSNRDLLIAAHSSMDIEQSEFIPVLYANFPFPGCSFFALSNVNCRIWPALNDAIDYQYYNTKISTKEKENDLTNFEPLNLEEKPSHDEVTLVSQENSSQVPSKSVDTESSELVTEDESEVEKSYGSNNQEETKESEHIKETTNNSAVEVNLPKKSKQQKAPLKKKRERKRKLKNEQKYPAICVEEKTKEVEPINDSKVEVNAPKESKQPEVVSMKKKTKKKKKSKNKQESSASHDEETTKEVENIKETTNDSKSEVNTPKESKQPEHSFEKKTEKNHQESYAIRVEEKTKEVEPINDSKVEVNAPKESKQPEVVSMKKKTKKKKKSKKAKKIENSEIINEIPAETSHETTKSNFLSFFDRARSMEEYYNVLQNHFEENSLFLDFSLFESKLLIDAKKIVQGALEKLSLIDSNSAIIKALKAKAASSDITVFYSIALYSLYSSKRSQDDVALILQNMAYDLAIIYKNRDEFKQFIDAKSSILMNQGTFAFDDRFNLIGAGRVPLTSFFYPKGLEDSDAKPLEFSVLIAIVRHMYVFIISLCNDGSFSRIQIDLIHKTLSLVLVFSNSVAKSNPDKMFNWPVVVSLLEKFQAAIQQEIKRVAGLVDSFTPLHLSDYSAFNCGQKARRTLFSLALSSFRCENLSWKAFSALLFIDSFFHALHRSAKEKMNFYALPNVVDDSIDLSGVLKMVQDRDTIALKEEIAKLYPKFLISKEPGESSHALISSNTRSISIGKDISSLFKQRTVAVADVKKITPRNDLYVMKHGNNEFVFSYEQLLLLYRFINEIESFRFTFADVVKLSTALPNAEIITIDKSINLISICFHVEKQFRPLCFPTLVSSDAMVLTFFELEIFYKILCSMIPLTSNNLSVDVYSHEQLKEKAKKKKKSKKSKGLKGFYLQSKAPNNDSFLPRDRDQMIDFAQCHQKFRALSEENEQRFEQLRFSLEESHFTFMSDLASRIDELFKTTVSLISEEVHDVNKDFTLTALFLSSLSKLIPDHFVDENYMSKACGVFRSLFFLLNKAKYNLNVLFPELDLFSMEESLDWSALFAAVEDKRSVPYLNVMIYSALMNPGKFEQLSKFHALTFNPSLFKKTNNLLHFDCNSDIWDVLWKQINLVKKGLCTELKDEVFSPEIAPRERNFSMFPSIIPLEEKITAYSMNDFYHLLDASLLWTQKIYLKLNKTTCKAFLLFFYNSLLSLRSLQNQKSQKKESFLEVEKFMREIGKIQSIIFTMPTYDGKLNDALLKKALNEYHYMNFQTEPKMFYELSLFTVAHEIDSVDLLKFQIDLTLESMQHILSRTFGLQAKVLSVDHVAYEKFVNEVELNLRKVPDILSLNDAVEEIKNDFVKETIAVPVDMKDLNLRQLCQLETFPTEVILMRKKSSSFKIDSQWAKIICRMLNSNHSKASTCIQIYWSDISYIMSKMPNFIQLLHVPHSVTLLKAESLEFLKITSCDDLLIPSLNLNVFLDALRMAEIHMDTALKIKE